MSLRRRAAAVDATDGARLEPVLRAGLLTSSATRPPVMLTPSRRMQLDTTPTGGIEVHSPVDNKTERTYGPFRSVEPFECAPLFCRVTAQSGEFFGQSIPTLEIIVYQWFEGPGPAPAKTDFGELHVVWQLECSNGALPPGVAGASFYMYSDQLVQKTQAGCNRMFAKAIYIVQYCLAAMFAPMYSTQMPRMIYKDSAMVDMTFNCAALQLTSQYKTAIVSSILQMERGSAFEATQPGNVAKLDSQTRARLLVELWSAAGVQLIEWAKGWMYRVKYFHELGFTFDQAYFRTDPRTGLNSAFDDDYMSYVNQLAITFATSLLDAVAALVGRALISGDGEDWARVLAGFTTENELDPLFRLQVPCATWRLAHPDEHVEPREEPSGSTIPFAGDIQRIARNKATYSLEILGLVDH